MKKVIVDKNRYIDSVTLMSIGDKVMKIKGVKNAEVQMGTWANIELLEGLGYEVPKNAGPDDLIMAVDAENKNEIDEGMRRIDDILNHRFKEEISYRDLVNINLKETPYDVVQISIPGKYAFKEADKALNLGLNVFMFSDNVSIEEEKALKEKGKEKGLLVMGPDCGVAQVGGVCLGAGSIMQDGEVGIIGASGSGSQEVACLLEQYGIGISELIGTGGRDLYSEIGGIEMIQALEMLEKDEKTKLIVLVSKLANLHVMNNVLKKADESSKPVVAIFLGSDETLYKNHEVTPAYSLEEAAEKAAKILRPDNQVKLGFSEDEIEKIADDEFAKYDKGQKYFRGLYCGGTFTEEGLLAYSKIPGIKLHSNLENEYSEKLPDSHKSIGHSILDMGAEDFTAEAPHPVFNPELRVKRIVQEQKDPETAVILIDIITGPGVAEDPFNPVIDAIKNDPSGHHITYIINVCGSKQDPQGVEKNKKLLKEVGAVVTSSSHESARVAVALMKRLEASR